MRKNFAYCIFFSIGERHQGRCGNWELVKVTRSRKFRATAGQNLRN